MRHRLWGKRLAKLDLILPKATTANVEEKEKRRRQVVSRLIRLCEDACLLMTEEEQTKTLDGMKQWVEDWRGPYAWWFRDLFDGRCRLPELAPATMKELLVALLSPDCDTQRRVCRNCGLLYPQPRLPPISEWKLLPGKAWKVGPPPWFDLPTFFPKCPECGTSELDIDWSHLVDKSHRPWMTLDGYVGKPIRTMGTTY